MTKTHILKTSKRTVRLSITELPDKVVAKLRFSKFGELGDEDEISQWWLPIFEEYDSDSRPIEMDNQASGEVATIFGGEEGAVIVVRPGPQ